MERQYSRMGRAVADDDSGFFFQREDRLFFVTSRHVVIDKPSRHFPNRLEIELHTDARNLTRSMNLSTMLYRDGKSVWRQGSDAGGEIEVHHVVLRDRGRCAAGDVFDRHQTGRFEDDVGGRGEVVYPAPADFIRSGIGIARREIRIAGGEVGILIARIVIGVNDVERRRIE